MNITPVRGLVLLTFSRNDRYQNDRYQNDRYQNDRYQNDRYQNAFFLRKWIPKMVRRNGHSCQTKF